ncbi:energy-coupling factor transporter ATP-binding protein EcfA2 [Lachnospiraceae bacterium PF1-21]
MKNVLNSVIKFDLHIHSKASEYKESADIVEHSTKENIDVLLGQLNQYNVALFSITDHNRFDPEIYVEINKILMEDNHPYPNVKAALAGVEFDVIVDEGMEKCHIIAVFDANNESDKFDKIKAGLDTNLLTNIREAYSRQEFEDILKEIGLNTILIASQRKDIHNQSGNHNSLSDSAIDVEEIIRVGYIDALEFQKPKVEGILLNGLRALSLPITLFSGSDCHEWSCYPYHDCKNQNKEFYHSSAKILPTFKGLLMAVSSPETRFNCSESGDTSIIDSIEIRGREVPLVKGVNAIIGENGSGKTTLLKLLNGKTSEAYVKKLVSDNALKANNSTDPQKVRYIEQGQIITKFNEKTLFSTDDDTNFKEVNSSPFREAYLAYADALKKCIRANIVKQKALSALPEHIITYESGMIAKNYYVDITDKTSLESDENPHEKAYKEIGEILKKANSILTDVYYEQYKERLERVVSELKFVSDDVAYKWKVMNDNANVKNIILGSVDDYLQMVRENSSTKDREIKEYGKKKNRLIESVYNAVKESVTETEWPQDPPILAGITRNPKSGFYFNRKAVYSEISMVEAFHSKMFVKEYRNPSKLQEIETFEAFSSAVMGCTSTADIEKKWKENFEKFISESTLTNDYIMEGTDRQIGNTLGEMSLSYYKFYTQDQQDWNTLIIDQPEDNISNNNISQKLIRYFNAIRESKQIIFVTHNPLLVVNLDVDNVIFVKNSDGEISAYNGCLEYEDEDTDILELIANNMDGGKETIEKRLKVYGKSY